MSSKETKLLNFLKQKGGLASYADLSKAGFNKALLTTNLKCNRINRIDKGLYQLSEGVSLSNPDLVIISIKIPRGVVCLLSALAFHESTNEIPKYVDIAIPRGTHANKIKYPPVKFYRFAPITWKPGIEEHKVGDHKIKVYSLAKTVADCFKFRNRIGVNVARDALKIAITEKGVEPKEIMHFAEICRVSKIIKPTLETIL